MLFAAEEMKATTHYASGRAMRIRNIKNKKFGYILLPIFVERFRGEKIRKAINRTDFDVVLKYFFNFYS